MSDQQIYRISFMNQDEVYEVYARHVFQGDLYGFVVVEDFVFGETSSIVIDPSEERLKSEFSGVKRSFIPMHEIIRIDQVEKRGSAKILPLPGPAGKASSPGRIHTPDRK